MECTKEMSLIECKHETVDVDRHGNSTCADCGSNVALMMAKNWHWIRGSNSSE